MISWQTLKEDYPVIMAFIGSLLWFIFARIGFFTVFIFVFDLGWM